MAKIYDTKEYGRRYREKKRLKKLGLPPHQQIYNQTLIKVKADPPKLSTDDIVGKEAITLKRKKVDKIASRIQNTLSTQWKHLHKAPFIIVVEGGVIKLGKTMSYHIELYQFGMSEETIKEFEALCNKVVKQWEHHYDNIEF